MTSYLLTGKIFLKAMIFYGSFLVFPYVIWRLWSFYRRRSIGGLFMLTAACVFIWARFIEPQWVTVKTTQVEGTRIHADIVLISDLHIGLYKSPAFAERIVERINALEADAVFLAGDILYEAQPAALEAIIRPLQQINKPVYAVLGNHDYQRHLPVEKQLRTLLAANKIDIIEQKILDLGQYRIAGLGDHWEGDNSGRFLQTAATDNPLLLLTHNPDSIMPLDTSEIDMVLSGHTHCGQIRLPWLYKRVIPSNYGFDCELERVKSGAQAVQVFITPGLGEIGLPMRLLNRPRIDVLHLRP